MDPASGSSGLSAGEWRAEPRRGDGPDGSSLPGVCIRLPRRLVSVPCDTAGEIWLRQAVGHSSDNGRGAGHLLDLSSERTCDRIGAFLAAFHRAGRAAGKTLPPALDNRSLAVSDVRNISLRAAGGTGVAGSSGAGAPGPSFSEGCGAEGVAGAGEPALSVQLSAFGERTDQL